MVFIKKQINMKRQIRKGVFETNSSSTHGIAITNHIVIFTDKEYKDYQNGLLFVNNYGEMMTMEEFEKEVAPIIKRARREWARCADNKSPKTYYTGRNLGEDDYVKDMVDNWKRSNLAREDSETELTWTAREINGELVHVLSIAKGEDYTDYI